MLRWFLAHLHASLQVVFASIRLARVDRGQDFDHLVRELREGRPFAMIWADPRPYGRVASRVLRWLPPAGMGACMKHSLILLHLWSRCGLHPELHLGVAPAPREIFRAHAWLTAGEMATTHSGFRPTFTFGRRESASRP